MKIQRLPNKLWRARTSKEYFKHIYDFVGLDPRGVEWENGLARRVIFFTEDFTPELAKAILQCEKSRGYFASVQELRLVATKLDRDLASKFQALNGKMRIFWMTPKEWVSRAPGAPDPAGFESELNVGSFPHCFVSMGQEG
jgi:hypothetical protein